MRHDFKYISKRDPRLKAAYADAIDLIREVQKIVSRNFTFEESVTGSYAQNMVTYDAKSNIGYDLDFDLILKNEKKSYTAKEIKNILREAMNRVAKRHGYDYPEDSTRVLTMKCKDRKNSKIVHSIDFAIIREYDEEGEFYREYIHNVKGKGQYLWCEQPYGAYELPDRILLLRDNGYWDELKERYLSKKNRNCNPNLHSRQLLSMAVNELIMKYDMLEEI